MPSRATCSARPCPPPILFSTSDRSAATTSSAPTGQTITLPAGTDSALKLLATAVNGAQPNQTFTVTYTDGTTATLNQSISDWAAPQNFTGETTAYTFAYRDTSGGSIQGGSYRLYEYSLTLNPNKTVKNITLPNDPNVELLAASLIPVVPTQINLSSAFNRTGIVTDGTTFSGGLDTDGDALSSNLLGTSITVGAPASPSGLPIPTTRSAPPGRPSHCRRAPTPL